MFRWMVPMCAFFFFSCTHPIENKNPDWIKLLIENFQNEPVGNPPQTIWRYNYKDQVVYYIPAQCCDQFSRLLDTDGNNICAPDGGFAGSGDGRCPDFFSTRTNEKLVWRDMRSP